MTIVRAALSLAAAGLCGLGWGQPLTWLIGFSALAPVFWTLQARRWQAALTVMVYHLAASRGLPAGAAVFFGATAPTWYGWALWVAAAAGASAPWALVWHRRPDRRAWLAVLNLVLAAIPPIGIIDWCSPLTAAGVLFPGAGIIGLLELGAGVLFLGWRRHWIAGLIASLAVLQNLCWAPPAPLDGWQGVNTHWAALRTGPAGEETDKRLLELVRIMDAIGPGQVLVLPETVLPPLDAGTFGALLLDAAADRLRARGGTLIAGTENDHDNVLQAIGANSAMLTQRVPVPIGMWRPWSNDGFRAHLLGTGTIRIGHVEVAALICYEEVLVYPALLSLVRHPAVLIGAANDWWARDTSIPIIQGQATELWGRLFKVPVIRATNM